ncbi:hypothetical protein CARUB_v10003846mg [Capsella rubella]|uniref:Phytocyanin domain-containing protein n=1 Tax=Capsella rubella TaxID=81985 RepID=R0FM51_9BRAS|nr:hypothetical protein CARUB_v10003846mg [Capsella rubella]
MALINNNVIFTSLFILVAVFGAAVGGTVHKTMMGDYEAWASSRTFHVGDSLVFSYNNNFHDVTEVTHNDFGTCESSKPLMRYKIGSDSISLTKPGLQQFICGVPDHCTLGQKLRLVLSLLHFLNRSDHEALPRLLH